MNILKSRSDWEDMLYQTRITEQQTPVKGEWTFISRGDFPALYECTKLTLQEREYWLIRLQERRFQGYQPVHFHHHQNSHKSHTYWKASHGFSWRMALMEGELPNKSAGAQWPQAAQPVDSALPVESRKSQDTQGCCDTGHSTVNVCFLCL